MPIVENQIIRPHLAKIGDTVQTPEHEIGTVESLTSCGQYATVRFSASSVLLARRDELKIVAKR